jgi:hypothetical protein
MNLYPHLDTSSVAIIDIVDFSAQEALINPRNRWFSHIRRLIRNPQLCTIASSNVVAHNRYFICDIYIRAMK